MFPSVVVECTPRTLTFCLAFINLLLVNSLLCLFHTRCIIFYRGAAVSFLTLAASFFAAWYTLFSVAVYFGFLAIAVTCSGAFHFWATGPKEFPLSLRHSLRSSSSLTALRSASSHSLSSMSSCCIDIRLMASSGTWSSTIFLKAKPVTFAQLFLLSICCRNSSISPLYLIWYSSRRALTSSWVDPNRRITCSLNISHRSYPSYLVSPSSPVIWFRYAIATVVTVAPCIFPRVYFILSLSSLHCNLFRSK